MYKLLHYSSEKLRLKKKKRASIGKLFYRLKISGKLSRCGSGYTLSGDKLTVCVVQAVVSVSQTKSGRVWLEGSRVEKYGQTDTSLGLWSEECDAVGDHLTAYDGPGVPGAEPPVTLVRLCRGGPVPQIVSSGPDLLLVFRLCCWQLTEQ